MKEIQSTLSKNDLAAINEFKKTLQAKLAASLKEIKLFGSKAKGHDTLYSDLDILIVATEVNDQIKNFVFDAAVDVNLKYDVVLSPLIYTNEDYNSLKNTYFYKSTHDEGISL